MRLLLALLLLAAPVWARDLSPAECPQPRFTGKAPAEYYERANPLAPSTDLAAAKRRFLGSGQDTACATCHGKNGDGRGPMSDMFDPRPRNFACAQTVNGIPDGQLFWIIRFGSPGTSMPPHPRYSDDQVWELVLYLRTLAR